MNTIGWVFILASILVFRAVSRGRVMELPSDLSDGFLALIRGDTNELTTVLARTGDSTTPDQGALTPEEAAAFQEAGNAGMTAIGKVASTFPNAPLATAVIRIGGAAKGYKFGYSGKDGYYDCSGLVWRACQSIGYKGSRFTTFDILTRKGFERITGRPEKTAQIGDIVLWPTHHMGVMTGPDRFYSARNPRSGIGETTISGFRKDAPIYVRYIG